MIFMSGCLKINLCYTLIKQNSYFLVPKTDTNDSIPVNILGICFSPTDVPRTLGVLFDAKFCFTDHVNSVIKSCFISLRDLRCICRFLSVDTSVVIAYALVSSHLDYCNSLFCSLSSPNTTRLQYI